MLKSPIAWVVLRPYGTGPAKAAKKARISGVFPVNNLSGKEENNADF